MALSEVGDGGAAVGAEFGAGEHHAHAFGAGDGLQECVAILALGGVGGDGGAAFGAVEGAGLHGGAL